MPEQDNMAQHIGGEGQLKSIDRILIATDDLDTRIQGYARQRVDPEKLYEFNPVENVWQFMRDNWLSNRVFTSHENIIDHCCEGWNKLIDQPWRIMTVGRRQWARGS